MKIIFKKFLMAIFFLLDINVNRLFYPDMCLDRSVIILVVKVSKLSFCSCS